jgi:hypothetical protein
MTGGRIDLLWAVQCQRCHTRLRAGQLKNKIVVNQALVGAKVFNPKHPAWRATGGDYLGDCPKCGGPVWEW